MSAKGPGVPLDSGLNYGFDKFGHRVCTGARMGRRNELPPLDRPIKLSLVKLPLVDCYDSQGGYWGWPDNLWYASCRFYCEILDDYCDARIFVRAATRTKAKKEIRELVPLATFYR